MNVKESKPPDFPRPSSAVARSRLQNRLVKKTNITSVPHNNGQNAVYVRREIASIMKSKINDSHDWEYNDGRVESVVAGEPPVHAVVGSSAWPDEIETSIQSDSITESSIMHMKSSIIKSHSLEVPGMESLVLQRSAVNESYSDYSEDMTLSYDVSLTSSNFMKVISHHQGIDQAIQLIVSGQQEFCYLEPIDPSNPYRLHVACTPKNKSSAKYITLSKTGIVRYGWGEPDRISLREFVREYYLYHMAIKIPFMKKFWKWKTFYRLRSYAIQTRREKMAKSLAPKLFFLDPTFRTLLLYCLDTCSALYERESSRLTKHLLGDTSQLVDVRRKVGLKEVDTVAESSTSANHGRHDGILHTDGGGAPSQSAHIDASALPAGLVVAANGSQSWMKPSSTMSKSALLRHLASVARAGGEKRTVEVLTEMPTVLSASSYFHYQQTNDLMGAIDMDSRSLARNTQSLLHIASSVHQSGDYTSTALPPPPAETPLSFTERAAIRLNCRLFSNALRLVDFMVRDTMYNAVEKALQSFMDKLQNLHEGVTDNGQILIALTMTDIRSAAELNSPAIVDDLELSIFPDKESVMEGLSSSMDEVLNAGIHDNVFLHRDDFAALLKPIRGEINDSTVDDLVFLDTKNSLHLLVDRCAELILDDVDSCVKEIESYHFLCGMYAATDEEEADLTLEKLSSMKTSELSEALCALDAKMEHLRSLPTRIDLGIVRLDIRNAVRSAYNKLIKCKNKYFDSVPKVFVSMGEEIYNRAHHFKVGLLTNVTHVDGFVKVIELYRSAIAQFESLDALNLYHRSLKEIMDDHKIPFSDEIFGLTATLRTEYQMYLDSLAMFEDSREEKTRVYRKDLINSAKELSTPINAIEVRLAADLLSSAVSDPVEALDEVRELEHLFSKLKQKSAVVVKCQLVMEQFVFDESPVKRIHQLLTLYRCLWESVAKLQQLQEMVYSASLANVDCNYVLTSLKNAKKRLMNLDAHEANDVENWLLEAIADLDALVPMLLQLQAKTLVSRHQKSIEAIIGAKIFGADGISVRDIQDLNIRKYSAEIEIVYYRSTCEFNLQTKLIYLQERVAKQKVHLLAHPTLAAFTNISNMIDCWEVLQDTILSVESALQSKYVEFIREEYETFHVKIRNWMNLLKLIATLQKENLRLRVLYTSARSTRYIHQTLRYFNNVDECWRYIVKSVRGDDNLSFLLSMSDIRGLVENAIQSAAIADEAVNEFVMGQREKYPKFYLVSTDELFGIHATAEMDQAFEKCRPMLFQNLTGIDMGGKGESQGDIDGVFSGSEALQLKSPCSTRGTIGDWLHQLDIRMTEKLQDDVISLASETRHVMEDARNPMCCNQARLLALEIKFWTDLKASFASANILFKGKMQTVLQLEISDRITMLTTLMSAAKDAHHVMCLSNMMLTLFQCRDVIGKVMAGVAEGQEIDEHDFMLESCLKKYFNSDNGSVMVHHSMVSKQYAMVYHGFQQRLVVTPMTERCYLAISATFSSLHSTIPFLRGSPGSGKSCMLQDVTHAFGQDVTFVNCQYEGNSEERLDNFVKAATKARMHMCFSHVEFLEVEKFSLLVASITASHMQSSSKSVSLRQDSQGYMFSRPHFSLSMIVKQAQGMYYFPASIRQNFRPLHITSPPLKEILVVYLRAYGFSNPSKSSAQLSAFIEHVCLQCGLDPSVMLKLLVRSSIPRVSQSVLNNSKVDSSQQCYLLLRDMFRRIPKHFHDALDLQNIKFSCQIFLGITFDIKLNDMDFKGREYDPLRMLRSVISSDNSVLLVGRMGSGKSALLREAIGEIEGYREHFDNGSIGLDDVSPGRPANESERLPKRLYPYIVNPLLFSTPQYMKSHHAAHATLSDPMETVLLCDREVSSRLKTEGIEALLTEISHLPDIAYVHLDVPDSGTLLEYGNRLNHYYDNSCGSKGRLKLLWECCDISNIDPAFALSVPIVFINDNNFTFDNILALHQTYFISRFGGDALDSRLQSALSFCIKTIVLPWLELCEHTTRSKESLVKSFFKVASCMYLQSGLSVLSDTDSSKITWDTETFYKVMVFSAIWTIGCSSKKSCLALEMWLFENVIEGTALANLREIFPPTADPFESVLRRPDEDHIFMKWISWSETRTTMVGIANVPASRYSIEAYCTAFDYDSSSFIVPTKYSVALTNIQNSILEHGPQLRLRKNEAPSWSIAVSGPAGVGKSSLLYLLVSAAKHYDRWLAVLHDTSPNEVIGGIRAGQSLSRTCFIENALPLCGAVFIDDFSFAYDSVNTTSNCGELLRNMNDNGAYFDPIQNGWVNSENIYSLVTGSSTDRAINARFLQNMLHVTLAPDEDFIPTVMGSKFQLMCPFVKPDLAYDLALLTVRLYEQFALLDSQGVSLDPLLRVCPPSWSTCAVLADCQRYLMDMPLVTSNEIGSTWKRVLNLKHSASSFEGQVHKVIDRLMGDPAFNTSTMKPLIAQGFEKQRHKSPRFASTVSLRRMSALQSAAGMPLQLSRKENKAKEKALLAELKPTTLTGGSVFVGLMSLEELRDAYVDSIVTKHAVSEELDVELVDTGNAMLWKDVQKCCVFLKSSGTYTYGIALGSTLPVIKTVLKLSSSICGFSYNTHLLDTDLSLEGLSQRLVRAFCLYLLQQKLQCVDSSADMFSVPAEFAEVVDTKTYGEHLGNDEYDKPGALCSPILWHLHLEKNEGVFTEKHWHELHHLIHLSSAYTSKLLGEEYGLYPFTNVLMRQHLVRFVSSIRVVISFGPYSNINDSLNELTSQSALVARIRTINFVPQYGVNQDMLGRVFVTETAQAIVASIAEVVAAVRDSEALENSPYYHTIQSQEYTQGTCDMIVKIFDTSCEDNQLSVWIRHMQMFSRLSSIFTTVMTPASDNDDIDISEMKVEVSEAFGAIDFSPLVQKQLLINFSDITWAVLNIRYMSLCPRSSREALAAVITEALTETTAQLTPQCTDCRGVVYAYFHSLVELRRGNRVEKLGQMIDMMIACGGCVDTMAVEYCAVIMAMLNDSVVRVGGPSHFVSQLLGDMCGLSGIVVKAPKGYHNNVDLDDSEGIQATKHDTVSSVESLLFSKSTRQVFDIVNPSTTVVYFDMTGTVCADTFILFYLFHNGYSDKALTDSWHKLFGSMEQARKSTNFSSSVTEFQLESYMFQAGCRMLGLQWKYQCNDIAAIVRTLNSFVSSIQYFPEAIYTGIPERILRVLTDMLNTGQKSLTLRRTIDDLLHNCFMYVANQVGMEDTYVIKLRMVLELVVPHVNYDSNHLDKLITEVDKYYGGLGFMPKKNGATMILSPQTGHFLAATFAYIGKVMLGQPDPEILQFENIKHIFTKYRLDFEEWTTVYSKSEYNLPIPADEKEKLTPMHHLMILIAVKPISINAFIENLIMSVGEWEVPDLHVLDSFHEENLKKLKRLSVIEIGFLRTLVIYQNDSGAIDTYHQPNPRHIGSMSDSSKTARTVKLWPGELCARAQLIVDEFDADLATTPGYSVGAISRNHTIKVDSNEAGDEIDIFDSNVTNELSPNEVPSTHAVVVYSDDTTNPENMLLPLLQKSEHDCAVECNRFVSISYGDEMADKSTTIIRGKVEFISMQNYVRMLQHTVSMLVLYHEEHMSAVSTETSRRISKPLARSYWIYALFHTSVLLRLDLNASSVGDDTLKQGCRVIMKIHASSHTSPEKIRGLIYHVCFELYEVLVTDVMASAMVTAMFNNYFTPYSLGTGDYFLLGLLALPETMEREDIDDFIVHMNQLINHNKDNNGLVDLLVCTSGELSENYRRSMRGFRRAVHFSGRLPTYALQRAKLTSMQLSVSADVVNRLRVCLGRLVDLMPTEVSIDILLPSIPGSRQSNSVNSQLGRGDLISSSRRVNRGTTISKAKRSKKPNASGEDRLWKVLMLEITCFNNAIYRFTQQLKSMMSVSTCPAVAASYLEDLEKGLVPPLWLKAYADQKCRPVNLNEWFAQLKERRQMLVNWQTLKHPDNLKLHLLQNPSAFFFALRQALGDKVNASVDTVKLESRIIVLPATTGERNALFAKIAVSNNASAASQHTVVVTSAMLMNALWEESKYCMGFMHPATSSTVSQEVCLTITATLEDTVNPDDYECPLFASSDFPTSENISQSSEVKYYPVRKPLMTISVPSTCDPLEWAKRKVALYCCPPWQLPEA